MWSSLSHYIVPSVFLLIQKSKDNFSPRRKPVTRICLLGRQPHLSSYYLLTRRHLVGQFSPGYRLSLCMSVHADACSSEVSLVHNAAWIKVTSISVDFYETLCFSRNIHAMNEIGNQDNLARHPRSITQLINPPFLLQP
jgi:hypothetical protein